MDNKDTPPPAVAGQRKAAKRERSLNRVCEILDFFQDHRSPATAGELARHLKAPRSTIYSLVRALVDAKLLENAGSRGEVFLGRKLYLYGMTYMRENDLVRRGRVVVDGLSLETGETAELCMLLDGRYTIVHMCSGNKPFRISSAVGLRIPLPWTASGRLLLSHLSPEEIERSIDPSDLLLPNGTRIPIEEFIASVSEARARGYCVTSGLVDAFTKCLAAPVYDSDGQVEATVCLVLPIDTDDTKTQQLLRVLLNATRTLAL